MNITTIIELENMEVERFTGAKLVFAQEQISENIVETCVECFQVEGSNKTLSTEDGMQLVFSQLKQKGIIPSKVEDFSFEMPSCGQLKTKNEDEIEVPQKVIISYMS
ncbi:hypothetical protein QFZ28_004662 [Neobacillus niacini]|jgi:hypothetical protein|uniref:hypothetical protein n=1 Tax=Neobacillus niacini TaxID=86668 RepID=UPI00278ABAED|nr:hypothetical protein [Neobacillus niacini]MDQ1004262.1 hypothetical protein [Neobacillus niacini]